MSHAATLVFAAVLGTAGVMKLRRTLAFRVVLKQLIPGGVARPLALAIPVVEIVLAALLLSGLWPEAVAAISMLALGCFTLALLQMWRVGVTQDCGCFGESREAASPASGVVRNAGLLCLAGVLVVEPRSIWNAPPGDLIAAGTIAIAIACLWQTTSTLLTRRAILFLPRSGR
jgi:putative oxidoreductase